MMTTGDATSPRLISEAVSSELAARAARADREGPWAAGCFDLLARHGVLAAFVPADCGGTAAGEPATIDVLLTLASTCLTTALAVSQWAAAIKIITTAPPNVRATILPALARGEICATVGVAQITTSRQHLGRPALLASRDDEGWRLDGLCPWVTGADASDAIVTGAATSDGDCLFFVVPTDAQGLTIDPPLTMLALSGSRTSAVHFHSVRPSHVIAPPERNTARTGGLATTALALGSARAAIALVSAESLHRATLVPVAESLAAEAASLVARLGRAAREGIALDDRDALRGDATSLALRAAQAALTASKGAGFVCGHPAERIARESFFYLVWSCPQSVSSALLCEWAGIAPDA